VNDTEDVQTYIVVFARAVKKSYCWIDC